MLPHDDLLDLKLILPESISSKDLTLISSVCVSSRATPKDSKIKQHCDVYFQSSHWDQKRVSQFSKLKPAMIGEKCVCGCGCVIQILYCKDWNLSNSKHILIVSSAVIQVFYDRHSEINTCSAQPWFTWTDREKKKWYTNVSLKSPQ